jgi:hypothetical protein
MSMIVEAAARSAAPSEHVTKATTNNPRMQLMAIPPAPS